jgi:hypothetical protein
VTDVASAQRAIDTILEQGEGARGRWETAHFGQFVQILDEYRQMKAGNPGFDPVRPVLPAKVRRAEGDDDRIPLITDRDTARCADLFNVANEVLLQTLQRYFAHTEETDEQLSSLARAAVGLMVRVLRPLGGLITTLPVGREHPGHTAGPSFELFYENDYLVPHREAAWIVLEERLRDAVAFCGALQDDCDPLTAMRLVPVEAALGDIADSLAAHQADWGGSSRFVAAREPHKKPNQQELVISADGDSVSFATHIQPLFRERDRGSMKFAFDLWSYDDVKSNAKGILARLENGSMPCDGAWPAEQIDTFRRWVGGGMAA